MVADPTKGTPPDDATRAKMRRVGEVLSNTMDRLGWDHYRLADATGYSRGFIKGTMSTTQWGVPSRPALRFMFDVMGADLASPDIVEVLGYGASKGIAAGKVKDKMNAFYNRPPGTTPQGTPEVRSTRDRRLGIVPDEPVTFTPATVEVVSHALGGRQAAVNSILDQLDALVCVDWDDVIEWLKTYGHALEVDRRDEVMRAIWRG